MKTKIISTLVALVLIVAALPASAFAQMTIQQGGTGWSRFDQNVIPIGPGAGLSGLRFATSSNFTFSTSTNIFKTLNASTTNLSVLTIGAFGSTATSSFDSAGIFGLVSAASVTVDAAGEMGFDNNAQGAGRGSVQVYDGTAATNLVGVLVSDTCTSGQVVKWNTGGTWTCEDDSTSSVAWPFTPATNFGQAMVGTTTGMWMRSSGVSLAASSTAWFDQINVGSTTSSLMATSTFYGNVEIVGNLRDDSITSALLFGDGIGEVIEYAGTSCTNQFPRSQDAAGQWTCATVGSADVSLANLTATDGTLTFSGTYNGSTARTIGINLANPNTWTGLQTITNASTTRLTVATEFVLPNSTNPTIANAGEIAINTTSASTSLRWHDGTAERAVSDIVERSFTVASTTAMNGTTTVPLGFAKSGETWIDSRCDLDQGAADIRFGDGTNYMMFMKLTGTATTTTFSSNNVFTMDEAREMQLGSTTPNWNYLTCTFKVRKTAD